MQRCLPLRVHRRRRRPKLARTPDELQPAPAPIPSARKHSPSGHSETARIPKAHRQPTSSPMDRSRPNAHCDMEPSPAVLVGTKRSRTRAQAAILRSRRDLRIPQLVVNSSARKANRHNDARDGHSSCRNHREDQSAPCRHSAKLFPERSYVRQHAACSFAHCRWTRPHPRE